MPEFQASEILIVEDDIDIREAIRDVLIAYGFPVSTATNGKEGLDYLRASLRANQLPSLVLLDLMMPVMGGREMLDLLLLDSELKDLPVFIVSAAASTTNTAGALGFLRKPVDIDELLELAERHSGHARNRRK